MFFPSMTSATWISNRLLGNSSLHRFDPVRMVNPARTQHREILSIVSSGMNGQVYRAGESLSYFLSIIININSFSTQQQQQQQQINHTSNLFISNNFLHLSNQQPQTWFHSPPLSSLLSPSSPLLNPSWLVVL